MDEQKKSADPASTTNQMIDREIGERVASASAMVGHPDATSAEAMTPVEMAIISMDRDLQNVLHHCQHLRRQAEFFETFACAIKADMDELRKAMKAEKL